MKRLGLTVGLVVVVFACGEPVGQMLADGGQMMMDAGDAMVPDAGAQQSEFFDYPCPADSSAGSLYVLTDVDQKELGKVVIRATIPDWAGTGYTADYQNDANLSVNGKVLAQCPAWGIDKITVEVLP
jgi:hypothetical protein